MLQIDRQIDRQIDNTWFINNRFATKSWIIQLFTNLKLNIVQKLNIDNYIKETTSNLKQRIRTL